MASEAVRELGAVADALRAGGVVTIEPGSVWAERILRASAAADAPSAGGLGAMADKLEQVEDHLDGFLDADRDPHGPRPITGASGPIGDASAELAEALEGLESIRAAVEAARLLLAEAWDDWGADQSLVDLEGAEQAQKLTPREATELVCLRRIDSARAKLADLLASGD